MTLSRPCGRKSTAMPDPKEMGQQSQCEMPDCEADGTTTLLYRDGFEMVVCDVHATKITEGD